MAWRPRWSRYRVPFSPFNRHTVWAEYCPDPLPPPPLTDTQAALKELQVSIAATVFALLLVIVLGIIGLAGYFGVMPQLALFTLVGICFGSFYYVYRRGKQLYKQVSQNK